MAVTQLRPRFVAAVRHLLGRVGPQELGAPALLLARRMQEIKHVDAGEQNHQGGEDGVQDDAAVELWAFFLRVAPCAEDAACVSRDEAERDAGRTSVVRLRVVRHPRGEQRRERVRAGHGEEERAIRHHLRFRSEEHAEPGDGDEGADGGRDGTVAIPVRQVRGYDRDEETGRERPDAEELRARRAEPELADDGGQEECQTIERRSAHEEGDEEDDHVWGCRGADDLEEVERV